VKEKPMHLDRDFNPCEPEEAELTITQTVDPTDGLPIRLYTNPKRGGDIDG